MINLLPTKEKEQLILREKKNLFIIFGIIILISVICLILILFSLKFYLLGEISSQKFILEQAESRYREDDFLKYKNLVQKYNTSLGKVSNFYEEETYFGSLLKMIYGIKRPAGVFFTRVSGDRLERGKINVQIFGFSNTRENLIILKNNLEEDKLIESFFISQDSWIKPTDLNFQLTVTFIKNDDE